MRMNFSALIAGAVCASAAVVFTPMSAVAQSANGQAPVAYVANLAAMNTGVTGTSATGTARFTVMGDSLTISIDMRGVAPGIMHLQHFHGFADGRDATCPATTADANHDGVVDLIETEPTSGTTMVPFTADPASMQIVVATYPTATAKGTYQYRKTVSLSALDSAFAKQYAGQKLDLAHRVVFIHGVPASTKLATSVASLGTIPAQVTIPIACGKINAVAR